jgi:hypothetical protein
MLTKQVIDDLLNESGVWNELAHVENGDLHTAITSREELEKLIELAYLRGGIDCQATC